MSSHHQLSSAQLSSAQLSSAQLNSPSNQPGKLPDYQLLAWLLQWHSFSPNVE
jgi:hypothetical protein